ncbi:glycosyl transferase family 1 [Thermosipho sp. 1063]|uniref:glycosyltransferase n=1 Tax=unclassified Thermosipho (in: thermotogales) TaxID=2676525 RepID=UPI00094944E9|nr:MULTISPECIES: glycosyltransferase [unclassified Thermosipho (in: thermotogales)]ANQ53778.1 glycosyl transferase family 1 [Thermosipho sp. 1070]APT72224.1 glycosyl transferase family 1 [Thermosipho sp. 1063]
MELIFIALDIRDDASAIGPSMKIRQQCEAFENNGFNVHELIVKNNSLYIRNKGEMKKIYEFGYRDVLKREENIILRKLKFVRRLNYIFNVLIKYMESEKIEFAYVRNLLPWNYFSVKFIKQLKKLTKFVILDVPTYPYKKELSKINLIIDNIFNRFVGKNINLVVTTADIEKIYGVRAIRITNGIDVKKYKLKKNIKKDGEFHLIGVANVSLWHGYDRVINGLYEYYKNDPKIKVIFHVVGEGKELNNLKKLTEEKKLNSYVIFHGFKTGDELDNLYDISDVAVGSLGLHRIGLLKSSVLKVREYCARGIPFIISSYDEDFDKEFEFMLKFPSDETPIEIEEILKFYERIKSKNYSLFMRKYAEEHLSWNNKMGKLLKEIK